MAFSPRFDPDDNEALELQAIYESFSEQEAFWEETPEALRPEEYLVYKDICTVLKNEGFMPSSYHELTFFSLPGFSSNASKFQLTEDALLMPIADICD